MTRVTAALTAERNQTSQQPLTSYVAIFNIPSEFNAERHLETIQEHALE
uniref:Uncharacterized protein n=1 Tax=Onchocerca volvulus TaxID=6282 RepID=A0A8R1TQF6_ONCVO